MGGNCCRAEFEIRPAASLSMGPSFAEHQIASRFLIIAPRKLTPKEANVRNTESPSRVIYEELRRHLVHRREVAANRPLDIRAVKPCDCQAKTLVMVPESLMPKYLHEWRTHRPPVCQQNCQQVDSEEPLRSGLAAPFLSSRSQDNQ